MNYLNAYILAAVVLGVITYIFIGILYLTVKVIKISHSLFTVWYSLVYLFYNQRIIDPCGTYMQSQVNTGIKIGIIYNLLT